MNWKMKPNSVKLGKHGQGFGRANSIMEDRNAMRLKKLILHGFKSFADRTEFVFDSPITGIVGPNGCGKTNVVDGFKWVLGEQSAKSLRGDAMMDVIFNGSSARKPSGMAEVALVFENPQAADGNRALNLDVDEVAVGRRLFRDGTSEYQLNNSTARLKDVRELFLDTGVGVDAYSVIEQGRVAAMLEANPEERRLIFEEAAGISKFKAQKKESQRKLEKVDQNLLRVNDIVEEVEKRLRSVKIQAAKARTFQEHSTKLGGAAAELQPAGISHASASRQKELESASEEDANSAWTMSPAILPTRRTRWPRRSELFESVSQSTPAAGIRTGAGAVADSVGQAAAAICRASSLQQIAEQLDRLRAGQDRRSKRSWQEVRESLESRNAIAGRADRRAGGAAAADRAAAAGVRATGSCS